MPDDQLIFLSNYRRSFPIAPDSPPGASRLTGTLTLGLKSGSSAGTLDGGDARSATFSHAVTFIGPGDVEGIHPTVISRLEPPPDTNDFEPNYFPFVEFRDPDFPWRYSLDQGIGARVQPWLELIVLSSQELKDIGVDEKPIIAGADGRIFLDIDWDSANRVLFPQSNWATAHVQVEDDGTLVPQPGLNGTDPGNGNELNQYIESYADRHGSRLFCFRNLEPTTAYTAFLVPFYKAGTEAGSDAAFPAASGATSVPEPLTEPVFADTTSTTLKVPVYYSWSFMTSEKGDFESLVRALKFVTAPPDIGTRVVDATLNFDDNAPIDQRFFRREGALAAPGFSQNRTSYREQVPKQEKTEEILGLINLGLADPDTLGPESEDPLISFPYYGRFFQKAGPVSTPAEDDFPSDQPWAQELNLDFRNRIAAGFGTRVVQNDQEDYAKRCWAQVGKLRVANEMLRLTQAALRVSTNLKVKHLDGLSNERFTLITTAFQSHFSLNEQGDSPSLKAHLNISGLPPGVVRSEFKRIAHQRIGLDRVDLFAPWRLAELQNSFWNRLLCFGLQPLFQIVLRFAKLLHFTWPGIRVLRRLYEALTRLAKKVAGYFACGSPRLPNKPFDLAARAKVEFGIFLHPGEGDILPPKPAIIPTRPLDITTQFRPRFNVLSVLMQKVKGVIRFNDERQIPENFDPIMDAPTLTDSMYKPLKALSLDYILPGLDNLPSNSVTLLEENTRFKASYMVGVNHEMGRELVWRLFPSDQRGTIFSHFWDPTKYAQGDGADSNGLATEPTPRHDISDIHLWQAPLGRNLITMQDEGAEPSPEQGQRVVLFIKGDLIRRYPDTIFFAVELSHEQGGDTDGLFWENPEIRVEKTIQPTFRGQLGADAVALGFPFTTDNLGDPDRQFYIVIQENQELPRFGLDVAFRAQRADAGGEIAPPGTDNEGPSWADITLTPNGQYIQDWSGLDPYRADLSVDLDSAEIAQLTLQRPIQIVIHASAMLKTDEP